jgi:hypothetical protein
MTDDLSLWVDGLGPALAAFLADRLDEDEATASYAGPAVVAWLTYRDDGGQMLYTTVAATSGDSEDVWVADGKVLPEPASARVVYDPARVLRDVAAGRALVEAYRASVRSVGEGLSRSLRQLVMWRAAVYDDHPDYRQEWAPGKV